MEFTILTNQLVILKSLLYFDNIPEEIKDSIIRQIELTNRNLTNTY